MKKNNKKTSGVISKPLKTKPRDIVLICTEGIFVGKEKGDKKITK